MALVKGLLKEENSEGRDTVCMIKVCAKINPECLEAVCNGVQSLSHAFKYNSEIMRLVEKFAGLDNPNQINAYVQETKNIYPKLESCRVICVLLDSLNNSDASKRKALNEPAMILIRAAQDLDNQVEYFFRHLSELYQLIESFEPEKRLSLCQALSCLVQDYSYDNRGNGDSFFEVSQWINQLSLEDPAAFCQLLHKLNQKVSYDKYNLLKLIQGSPYDHRQSFMQTLEVVMAGSWGRDVIAEIEKIASQDIKIVLEATKHIISQDKEQRRSFNVYEVLKDLHKVCQINRPIVECLASKDFESEMDLIRQPDRYLYPELLKYACEHFAYYLKNDQDWRILWSALQKPKLQSWCVKNICELVVKNFCSNPEDMTVEKIAVLIEGLSQDHRNRETIAEQVMQKITPDMTAEQLRKVIEGAVRDSS